MVVIGLQSDFNNGIILQFGYALNVSNGGKVMFPVSFLHCARCVQNIVNSGYAFINIISVDLSYISYSLRLASGGASTFPVMWIAIGY